MPVSLRIFLKKYGVLPSHITFFHVKSLSVAESDLGKSKFEVINLGRDIDSVIGTYGYMEQPDIRGAVHELQAAGKIEIPSDRWIIESGEEEIITSDDLPTLRWLRIVFFRTILRLSTPAHKFLGLGYDAGVSKEIIPIVFSKGNVRIALPELEIVETEQPAKPVLA